MSAGPEHYKVAETLLARLSADHYRESRMLGRGYRDRVLAEAQVHATLALAAATLATSNRSLTDADDWAEVLWR